MSTSADERAAAALTGARRVVVKIGSSLLVDSESGRLNREWLAALAEEFVRLRERGQQLLVVSSGAIALGRRYLGMQREQRRLEELQAAAAAGQVLLAHAYQDILGERGLRVAQWFMRPAWYAFGDGCRTNRDTGKAIRDAGFRTVVNMRLVGRICKNL